MDAASPANQTSVSQQRQQLAMQQEALPMSNQAVDMFTERGFALAVRLAKAYSTSDAVPACFRASIEKKGRNGSTWTENPAALGNCLVAIETARAVGVSITSVMQNANMIEGRLTWSAQYKIAAINASGRFTPLRFDLKNLGRIKAAYKEKQGWNEQKRGFDFKTVEVEVDNWKCIAWALPHGMQVPNFSAEQMRQHSLLELVKAAGLPVIESAPVSMKMAVEEGWYAKPGSKWQTEMFQLMLQYRSGSFFGNIHAPDIVMGMGRTTEEVIDMTTVDVNAAGDVTGVTTETVTRTDPPAYVAQVNTTGSDDEQHGGDDSGDAGGDQQQGQDQGASQEPRRLKYSEIADAISKASTEIEVQAARALIKLVEKPEQEPELEGLAQQREAELAKPAATTSRRKTAAPKVGE